MTQVLSFETVLFPYPSGEDVGVDVGVAVAANEGWELVACNGTIFSIT